MPYHPPMKSKTYPMYTVFVGQYPGVVFTVLQTIGKQVKSFLYGRSDDCTYSVDICFKKRLTAMEVHEQILCGKQMSVSKSLILIDSKRLVLCIITIKTLMMKTITATEITIK
jgi:hypothetical protein